MSGRRAWLSILLGLSMTGALAMGLSSAPDSQYLRGEVFERHKRDQEPQTPELEHRAGPPIGRHWGGD